MTLRLQHEEVKIAVLRGRTCFAFRAVENLSTGVLALFYLQVEGTWHRFFLDAGLLFWEEGPGPNPDEDLLDGERYVDLASALGVNEQRLADIEMHDSQLRVEFENGAILRLQHRPRDQETTIIERVSAQ